VIGMRINCWPCLKKIEATRDHTIAETMAMASTVSRVKGQREISGWIVPLTMIRRGINQIEGLRIK
jgi:hypothetical protein